MVSASGRSRRSALRRLPGGARGALERVVAPVGPFGAATLALLTVWATLPVAFLLLEAGAAHETFVGAQSIFPADQLQYFAWIRSSGAHVLASNAFDLRAGGNVFLHPMFLLSGLLWRAGISAPVAYLLWGPVAIGVLFTGFALYAARTIRPGPGRAAALVVALFGVTPVAAVLAWWHGPGAEGASVVTGEVTPADALWGYLPTAVTIGLMPLFMLGLERVVDRSRRASGRSARWYVAWTALAGLLVSWLHPWQGETLLVTLGALLVWSRGDKSHVRLAVTAAAVVLPLIYYFALSKTDVGWMVAQAQTPLARPHPLVLVVVLGPLIALGVAGVRRDEGDVQERILVVWPSATLVVYAISTAYPPHALEGVSLPLCVLAVRGWQRIRLPGWMATATVAVATLPGLIFGGDLLRRVVDVSNGPFFLRSEEVRALAFLERAPGSEGVLASPRLATAIPSYTGRKTWAGHPIWTPHYWDRLRATSDLFAARLPPDRARVLVRRSGAGYVFSDCSEPIDLGPALGTLVAAERRFGCATVYRLSVRAAPAGL